MITSSSTDDATAPAAWREIESLELTPILDAALDAFYENGFHGTPVREIARRVGVTIPSLYYHHQNKEGILLALLEVSTKDVVERARAAAEDGGDDPRVQLANVIESIVLRMTARARLVVVESEVRYLSPENRQRYRIVRKGVEEVVLGVVTEGVDRGVFVLDDALETSRALGSMLQSIPRWYNAEGKLRPEEVATKYVEIALNTVGYNRSR